MLKRSPYLPLRAVLQLQPKLASPARRGIDTYLAAHPLRRAINDRQAESGAFILSGGINPLENPENSPPVVGLDANAVVLKKESDGFALWPGINPNARPGFRRHELDGIGEQVRNTLRQKSFMPHDRKQRALNVNLGLLRLKERVLLDHI